MIIIWIIDTDKDFYCNLSICNLVMREPHLYYHSLKLWRERALKWPRYPRHVVSSWIWFPAPRRTRSVPSPLLVTSLSLSLSDLKEVREGKTFPAYKRENRPSLFAFPRNAPIKDPTFFLPLSSVPLLHRSPPISLSLAYSIGRSKEEHWRRQGKR